MSADDSRNRRRYRRMRLSTRVDLMLDEKEGFVSEATGDVSEGGMFIATSDPLPEGTIFVFGLRPRRGFPPVRGRAEVMWRREAAAGDGHAAGMGVRFLELSRADRTTIRSLLVFETEVDMDFIADDAAPEAEKEPAPVVTPGLRELSDVFPPPGETGIGFFAVQEEAKLKSEERHRRGVRNRRTRRLVIAAALIAVVICVAWRLLSRGHADGVSLESTPVAAQVVTVVDEAAEGLEQPQPPPSDIVGEPDSTVGAEPAATATAVLDLECAADERGAVVRIRGNGTFLSRQLRVEALQSPPRFVIRILGISHPFAGEERTPPPQVLGVRVGHHLELDVPQLFVVLDLASASLRSLPPEIDGDELVIRLVDGAADLS